MIENKSKEERETIEIDDLTYLGNNLREDTIQENYYSFRKYDRHFLDRECTLFNLPTFTKAHNSSTLSIKNT